MPYAPTIRTKRSSKAGENSMNERVAKVASLRDNSPLADRPEWLSPKDLQEVFGIGRSKAFNVCNALPHIYIGRSIRVNKKTIAKELLEKGRLP